MIVLFCFFLLGFLFCFFCWGFVLARGFSASELPLAACGCAQVPRPSGTRAASWEHRSQTCIAPAVFICNQAPRPRALSSRPSPAAAPRPRVSRRWVSRLRHSRPPNASEPSTAHALELDPAPAQYPTTVADAVPTASEPIPPARAPTTHPTTVLPVRALGDDHEPCTECLERVGTPTATPAATHSATKPESITVSAAVSAANSIVPSLTNSSFSLAEPRTPSRQHKRGHCVGGGVFG